MLTIEFEPAEVAVCPRCGQRSTRLTRFVSRDDDAYAIYYAAFCEHHSRSFVDVLVGIGDWAEDASPASRVSFYLRIRSRPEQFEVTVCDASESPWGDIPFVGRTLTRDEALAHPEIQEIFHITDHIVTEDTPVVEYLGHATQNA
jgi:hypothetical protein